MSELDKLGSWSPPEYPEDVSGEIEDRIAQVISSDNDVETFYRNSKNQFKFGSVVYWT